MGFPAVLFAVLVLAAIALICQPLFGNRRSTEPGKGGELTSLLKEKERILQLIRDLDFDHHTGKILEADYQAARKEAESRALTVLRKLDGLERSWTEGDLEAWVGRERERLRKEERGLGT